MKCKVLILSVLFCALTVACTSGQKSEEMKVTEVAVKNDVPCDVNFELYETTNMWTFIKLDTRTGQMWQVQYDVSGDNRVEVVLNPTPFVQSNDLVDGRFALYPTKNMFTFILLDREDGRTWQVQWSIDEEKRLVLPILSV